MTRTLYNVHSSPKSRTNRITMRILSGLLLLASSAIAQRAAAPQSYQSPEVIPIISYLNENNYDGSYRYSYETGNGISVQEDGYLKNPGQKDLEAQTARGTYTYTAPDGQVITVNWYADETGFHAEGAHLPTPPTPASVPRPQPGRPAVTGGGTSTGAVRPRG